MKKNKEFKLKLGPRQLTDQEIAEQIAKKATEQQKEQRKLIKEWISVNSDFDKQKYIEVWEGYRKDYGERFMDECLRIYAIANAALDVNTMLTVNMGMKNAGIDINAFTTTLGKMFIINLTQTLVEKVNLDSEAKKEILVRIIAREFPSKENRQQQPNVQELMQRINPPPNSSQRQFRRSRSDRNNG